MYKLDLKTSQRNLWPSVSAKVAEIGHLYRTKYGNLRFSREKFENRIDFWSKLNPIAELCTHTIVDCRR